MYPISFQKLINQFSALPGIGPKMAERLVLYIYKLDSEKIEQFIADLHNIKNIKSCKSCFNIAQNELCAICMDKTRDSTQLCVVEESLDIIPIERSRAFHGFYHVLGGTIKKSNIENITAQQLVKRIEKSCFTDIILATNFTTEGDYTAMYIHKLISSLDIKVFRIARGLATGSDIEYADDMSIRSSLSNRELL